MTKKLTDDSVVHRELILTGIPAPLSVEMHQKGIRLSVRGSKKWISVSWQQVIAAAQTSTSVPAYLMNRPMEFLLWQARNYKLKGHVMKPEERKPQTHPDQKQMEMWTD
jgi:hypothetical protein